MTSRSKGALPFEAVVERHGQAVLRFCVARLGPDRGEEALQETLLAALRHYDDLRDPTAVASWLFAIAQRKVVDIARSQGKAPAPSELTEEFEAVWHDPHQTGGVWSQVATLPPKQREALGLRYLADLPHADIARVMKTTTEAARRSVFEGLKRLRNDFAEDSAEPTPLPGRLDRADGANLTKRHRRPSHDHDR
jgi:RNA polymerase sigma factor (sigma-70 family)